MHSATMRAVYWSMVNPNQYIVVIPEPKAFRKETVEARPAETIESARSMIDEQFSSMRQNHPELERTATIMRGGLVLETIRDETPNPPPVFLVEETFGYRYDLTEKARQWLEAQRRAAAEAGVS
ncbi:MAG: hypothetical protein MUF38_01530 [Anaerolineae bacterium]|jgi:hypothetical protein|nr:hypothetical protein [Anaerolineae bacterium]